MNVLGVRSICGSSSLINLDGRKDNRSVDCRRTEIFSQEAILKLSARNILRGVVENVEHGAVNSEVTIQLPGGLEVVSIITRDPAERLELSKGKEVYAVIKASDWDGLIAPYRLFGKSGTQWCSRHGPILDCSFQKEYTGIDDLHKLMTESRFGRKCALLVIRGADKLTISVIPEESLKQDAA
jgi:molybdopterin-binding protein